MAHDDGGGSTLLVAATGGHLAELFALRDRLDPAPTEVEWATFDNGQSRSLLAGEVVHYIPRVDPKDVAGVVRNLSVARDLFARRRLSRVISTGAGVAVPYFLMARRRRLECHYIESAARIDGPSLTGKVLSGVPGVHLYGQHAWGMQRWVNRGSVFDAFASSPQPESSPVDKVVVTFGTQRGYDFRRAVERLVAVLPEVCTASAEILWQTGSTDTTGLGVSAVDTVPYHQLDAAIGEADLVISHAGVGSALQALSKSKIPVLLPRRRAHREHTDDHQRQLAVVLGQRRLSVSAEVDKLTPADLLAARAQRANSVPGAPFALQSEG